MVGPEGVWMEHPRGASGIDGFDTTGNILPRRPADADREYTNPVAPPTTWSTTSGPTRPLDVDEGEHGTAEALSLSGSR